MTPESTPGELTTVFAHLHGMLLAEEDAGTAVRQLARAVHQSFPTAAGAGVSLFDEDGARATTGATDALVEDADVLQYRLGEGPCLSAWATGQVQRIEDTVTDARWARWASAAAEGGIRSVLSVPLVHRRHGLGAMKVYAAAPGAFGDAEVRLLGLLADVAATLLGAAQPVEAPVRLSASLRETLRSRETVALATGVLMARDRLGPEAARSALLSRARGDGRRVVEVASAVLAQEQVEGPEQHEGRQR